ncbi:hypothetical protein [Candidatus Pelagibacter sp.]|uniref:hypothetical protein n=1 Tax=Candidatus Pelagibacter sp. TaxID=2024849 RepID=UPI003D1480FB
MFFTFVVGFIQGIIYSTFIYFIFSVNKAHSSLSKNLNTILFFLIILIINYNFWFHLNSTHSDIYTSILILCSIILFLEEKSTAYLVSGLLIGFSIGFKLTNIFYLFGIFIFFKNFKIKNITYYISGIIIGFFIIHGIWSINLYLKYDNPFFPYFNGFFKSEFYKEFNWYHARLETLNSTLFDKITFPISNIFNKYSKSSFIFSLIYIMPFLTYNNKFNFKLSIYNLVTYFLWSLSFFHFRYAFTLELLIISNILIFINNNKFNFKHLNAYTFLILYLILFNNFNFKNKINNFSSYDPKQEIFKIDEKELKILNNNTLLTYDSTSLHIPFIDHKNIFLLNKKILDKIPTDLINVKAIFTSDKFNKNKINNLLKFSNLQIFNCRDMKLIKFNKNVSIWNYNNKKYSKFYTLQVCDLKNNEKI